ncbi:MAG: acyl-ACP thioesterase domain-containing protein [Bacteroidota bacterium]
MPPEAPLVWTQPFTVRAYEVGPGDVASPLAVIDYLQEAAGEHARALGVEHFDIGDEGAAWVLSRLAMEIERLPSWREAVTIETWPSGRDGLRATRDLVLRDASGGVIVRARTVWYVFDLARRRPTRLPPAVMAIDPPDRPASLDLPDAPTPPEAAGAMRSFDVRRSDLDRNGHANNARFAEWALEAADRPLATLRALDLAFKGEALVGDTIESTAAPEAGDGASGGDALAHAILRASDRRLLATARTLWT